MAAFMLDAIIQLNAVVNVFAIWRLFIHCEKTLIASLGDSLGK